MHKTNEAWGQFTSNSIQAINENRHLFIEEDLLSAFSKSKWAKSLFIFEFWDKISHLCIGRIESALGPALKQTRLC